MARFLEGWPRTVNTRPREAGVYNTELRYVDGDQIQLNTARENEYALVPVFNPITGDCRPLKYKRSEAKTLDFINEEINGRQVGAARTAHTGWDIRVLVKNDFNDWGLLATPHMGAVVVPTGYGDYLSGPLWYVCLTAGVGGANALPFVNVDNEILYKGTDGDGPYSEMCIVSMDDTLTREAIPFWTVPTTHKAQIPKTARKAKIGWYLYNNHATAAQLQLDFNTVTSPAVLSNWASSVNDSVEELNGSIDVPIPAGTYDTALYKTISGGSSGTTAVSAWALGFSL